MAIFKFSNAGGFANYTRYNDFLAGNATANLDKGSMFPLGTITLTSAQSNITFTSIPTTYKHLQIRMFLQTNVSSVNQDNIRLRLNGDTGSTGNYTRHQLVANGSTVAAGNAVGDVPLFIGPVMGQNSGATFSPAICDILDYSATNKLKTVRTLSGWEANGSGLMALYSGWVNISAAITSLEFLPQSGTNWNAGSTISLYGVLA